MASLPPTSNDLSRTPGQGLTKELALQRILEGHWRYLAGQPQQHPVTARDHALHAQGQFPFAAIMGCADSRVSPELIFDQGSGDLFVTRVAGNILESGTLASLEYAVEHLGVRLLIVLGHEQCGAVGAALKASDAPGAIGTLLREIAPAVLEARAQPGDLLQNAVENNVRRAAAAIPVRSEMLARRVQAGEVRIVGAVYRLATGDVDIKTTIG
jgi:carbonic anhydrase